MKKFKSALVLSLAMMIIVLSAGCGRVSTGKKSTAEEVPLTVSCAASLKDAMNEIKTAYETEKPGIKISYNFGSSGSLQQQIEQGAPVDVFISAAEKQMDALQSKNLIVKETRKNLLGNKIVLIVPKANTTVKNFKDLTSKKVKKVGLGELKTVPVGQYAQELLTNLKLMTAVKPKAVYGKDVKTVLAWVETGNVNTGIVYLTDAKVSKKVKIVATAPDSINKKVIYPSAVIKSSKNVTEATNFINYLYSAKAKKVFQKYSFTYIAK